MLYPLLLMIVAFYALFTCCLLLNLRADLLRQGRRTQWVRDVVSQEA